MNEKSKRIRIMVVDDAPEFCEIVDKALSNVSDLEVIATYTDASSALKEIPDSYPDLIIFDLILSKMDGIAFLEKAMQLTKGIGTKYIAVSTISNESAIRRVMNLGASYYMVKTINYDDLSERIRMLCADKHIYMPQQNLVKQAPVEEEEEDMEKQVTTAILEIGIPAHVKGYHYVRSAILLAIEAPDAINAVTKIIYPTIAKMYNTTSSRVERAIRHAIEVAWDRGNVDILNNIFGYSISSSRGKPTNSEFIAMIADRLRLKNKKKDQDEKKIEVPTLI